MKALNKLLVVVMVMSLVVHPAFVDVLLAIDYEGTDNPGGTIPAKGDLYQRVQDALILPPPPPPPSEPEQENEDQSTSDSKTDLVANNSNAPVPQAADVPEEDQDALEWLFGARPVRSETVTQPGGTRTDYYDEDDNLVGYSTQTQGTQYTQPTKWFNADGEVIKNSNGDPFEATLVSAGDEQDTVKNKTGKTAVWKKVSYSEDNKIETTSYFTIEVKFAGSVKKQQDADGKNVETWKTRVPTGEQDAIKGKVGEKPVWQKVTVSADGKITTTQYFNAKNNELGSKTVKKDATGKDVTAWTVKVPADKKDEIAAKIGEKPVWQQVTTSADGKVTTTNYYDKDHNLVGQKQASKDAAGKDVESWRVKVPTADQAGATAKLGEQPALQQVTTSADGKVTTTQYFDKDGNLVGQKTASKDAAGKDVEAWRVKISSGDQAEVTGKFGVKPAWQEVTVSADGKTTTTKYFTQAGKEIGSKSVTQDATGKDVTTWNATIKAPTKPTGNTVAEWDKYYTDYVVYIGQLDDLTMRKTAWENLGTELLAQAKANPGTISARAINGIMNTLTAELKKIYRGDGTYKLDVSKAEASIVEAALTFAKSSTFAAMDDATKVGISGAFTSLGVELTWRKSSTDLTKVYDNIAEFYKTVMQDKSGYVSAAGFQHLMGMWRYANWNSAQGNAAVAKDILTKALNFTGGIQGLITNWNAAIDKGDLAGDTLGMVEAALAQTIWQYKYLNNAKQAGVADITSAQLSDMATRITAFLNKVNEGKNDKYKLSLNMRNHLVNCVGSAAIILMYETDKDGKNVFDTEKAYKDLGNAYIDLANDLLANSGSVAYQTSAINVTTSVRAHAIKTGNKNMQEALEDVLLNNDKFSVDKFLSDARAQMGTTGKADYEAWVASAMNNIQKINLEFKADPRAAEIKKQQLAASIASIRKWIENPTNRLNMRDMSRQAGIYSSLNDLLQQVYKNKSGLGLDMDMKKDIAAIFGTIRNLRDDKVKAIALASANALVAHLEGQKNSDYAYLATMIKNAIK